MNPDNSSDSHIMTVDEEQKQGGTAKPGLDMFKNMLKLILKHKVYQPYCHHRVSNNTIEVKKPIYFKETDYHLRVPHEHFNSIKTLETTAMSSVNTQPMLRVHVLCSGIRYGNGERTFYDHFQKAWI